MITEHTETTTTTPRQNGAGSGLSAINHEHGTTTHQHTPHKEDRDRQPAAPVLKDARVHYTVLKQQPAHPTHWWAPAPEGTTTTGRTPGTQTQHPHHQHRPPTTGNQHQDGACCLRTQ